MPLICQMSALTARPQRIPDLSQITYPSDSSLVMSVTINIYKTSSAQFYNCASVWMAYHHLNISFLKVFDTMKIMK